MKRIILFLLILLSLLSFLILLAGYRNNHEQTVAVDFVAVTRGNFISSISTTGKIISRKTETVKSTKYGIILDSGYQNKDYVKKGAVIAEIKLEERELQKKQQ